MAKKPVKKETVKKFTAKQKQEGFSYLTYVLSEAFGITSSLVFFPVVFVLGGVYLDKKLNTVPLFIIIGIILGIAVGVWQAIGVARDKRLK
jgi:F0F1-type ATP synthase assembly protein I